MSRRCSKKQTRETNESTGVQGASSSTWDAGEMLNLLMRSHGFAEVSQEVVGVAEVTVGSPLSGAVSQLLHNTQICPANTQTGQTPLCLRKDWEESRRPLTRSTRLPSWGPPWPPLGNLQVRRRSSRCFCLWRGTRYQSCTALVPDPPGTNPGRKRCC